MLSYEHVTHRQPSKQLIPWTSRRGNGGRISSRRSNDEMSNTKMLPFSRARNAALSGPTVSWRHAA